jgi:hypothetical protein
LTPRYPDVEVAALQSVVSRCTEHLKAYPDLIDPRYLATFVSRAQARYALGTDALSVVNDYRSAARCLDGQAKVRLYKLEKHRLKTRRLDPMHLSLLHAQPDVVERFGSDYGLPLATFYAAAGDADLSAEVRMMSPYFQARELATPADMVGLAAASYASALGSIMAGEEGTARAVLRLLAREGDALEEAPPLAGRRYLLQCAALVDLLEENAASFVDNLVRLAPYCLGEREKALARDPQLVRREGEGGPDLAIVALVGLAMLLNIEVELTPLQAVAPGLVELADVVVAAWELVE